MSAPARLGRRGFLQVSGGAGAGLWLSLYLPARAEAAAPAEKAFAPNAWLQVDPAGEVTVHLAKAEMGQGSYTGMAVLVAEELEADWKRVRVVQADADERFGNMMTGGSSSVRGSWKPLRQAGAAAREMLLAAAARQWKVEKGACRAEAGQVHGPGGKVLPYGKLAGAAAREEVPKDPPLKDPKDFRLIGRRVPRLDGPDKTRGKARFGLDVRVPGQRFAAVARPPVKGGKVAGFDAAGARKVKGVKAVVEVPGGVAVVADGTWAALRGREALAARFEPGPNGGLDMAAVTRLLAEAKPEVVRSEGGDVEKGLASAATRLEATYELPFLAHAAMEPMNCTAHWKDGGVEIWAPTQAATWAREAVSKALGIPVGKVKLHVTFLGGGFGRRALPDFVVEAAQVARAAGGGPVQVVWTREDDLRHDFYRPAGRNELRAGLDGAGKLLAWDHLVRTPSISQQLFGTPARRGHPDVVEGAVTVPYAAATLRIQAAMPEMGVPLGWWRSVYSSQNAFAEECFLDEVAQAAGQDPLAFRLSLLPAGHRLRAPLELAAARAGWGKPLPAGRGRGIACHTSFGSHVAEVAEVSVEQGKVRVHRVVVAVDCGTALNPDSVEHQVEGAIAYGLSAALRGEITLAGGAVVQGNFDDYEPLRMPEMPAVEVHLVPSAEPPGGIGEPGLPPIAPAVANALHAVTGKRVRRLPIRL